MRLQTFNVVHPHLRNRDLFLFVVLQSFDELLSTPVISPSGPGGEGFGAEEGHCAATV